MSLYDDLDVKSKAAENVSGWSSGIKLLQSQLQLKKATVTQPKREQQRKISLAPVINLKSKQLQPQHKQLILIHQKHDDYEDEEDNEEDDDNIYPINKVNKLFSSYATEFDWSVVDEYDPLWQNEYDKFVKDMRINRDRENDKEEKRLKERKRKSRFGEQEGSCSPTTPTTPTLVTTTTTVINSPLTSGFSGLWKDEDEDEEIIPIKIRSVGGAAIAPPPSLQEPIEIHSKLSTVTMQQQQQHHHQQLSQQSFGGSVAAKIMAKYGFKEGQGLGKQEQGMSSALQVEKISKRCGRIIHEKDIISSTTSDPSPQQQYYCQQQQPSITEIIKNPSKVVLLKNMVGPGEVDDDLEPEVKDECNSKYGEVTSVLIHETNHEDSEEAVRIFVEFKRIESAIKAVVDLNGRFFGGRQVKANFYDPEKFDNLELFD